MIKIGKLTTCLLYDDPFVTKIFNLHFVTLIRRKEFLGVFIIIIIRDWPNKYRLIRETKHRLVSNYHVNMLGNLLNTSELFIFINEWELNDMRNHIWGMIRGLSCCG